MPWSAKQHRMFQAIAHGAKIPGVHISAEDAKRMAAEGVKPEDKAAARGQLSAVHSLLRKGKGHRKG